MVRVLRRLRCGSLTRDSKSWFALLRVMVWREQALAWR
jgi:hypothetical protein